jgi:hypothetical protein
MRVIDKAMALLEGLTPSDIRALPPAHRQRFAALCEACRQLAERLPEPEEQPGSGVLSDLRRGQRQE